MIATVMSHLLPSWFLPQPLYMDRRPATYLMSSKDGEEEEITKPEVTITVVSEGSVAVTTEGEVTPQPPARPKRLPEESSPRLEREEDEVTEIKALRAARRGLRGTNNELADAIDRFKRKSGEMAAVKAPDEKEKKLCLLVACPRFRCLCWPTSVVTHVHLRLSPSPASL